MAKDKSAAQKAAEQAAAQQAPAKDNNNQPRIDEGKANHPAIKGLSQGEKVAYIASLQTERAYILNGGEAASKTMIDGLTMLAQATILDVAISEIATGSSVVGNIITANENNYEFLRGMALERGVKLPEFKALPAPTEEQLKQAGIVGLIPTEARVVNIEKKDVSEKTIEKKKKEIAATAKAVLNPAEIENDEQLKASLTALLVKPITEGTDRPDARVQRTIKFYRGYLTIQANKAENKEEALNKVKNMSMTDMLNEMSAIVGPCPFALKGAGYFLRKVAAETGSPISSFCLYRRGAVPEKDGSINDEYMADVTRILLTWSINSQIEEFEELNKNNNKILKNGDDKAKKTAQAAITYNDAAIKELKDLLEVVINPSFDIVDNLIDNYKSEDTESVAYKVAHRIVNNVMDTYYPELKGKKVDEDTMLKNAQQYAGIILNMFCGPMSRSTNYSEANLLKLEELQEEEPAKN